MTLAPTNDNEGVAGPILDTLGKIRYTKNKGGKLIQVSGGEVTVVQGGNKRGRLQELDRMAKTRADALDNKLTELQINEQMIKQENLSERLDSEWELKKAESKAAIAANEALARQRTADAKETEREMEFLEKVTTSFKTASGQGALDGLIAGIELEREAAGYANPAIQRAVKSKTDEIIQGTVNINGRVVTGVQAMAALADVTSPMGAQVAQNMYDAAYGADTARKQSDINSNGPVTQRINRLSDWAQNNTGVLAEKHMQYAGKTHEANIRRAWLRAKTATEAADQRFELIKDRYADPLEDDAFREHKREEKAAWEGYNSVINVDAFGNPLANQQRDIDTQPLGFNAGESVERVVGLTVTGSVPMKGDAKTMQQNTFATSKKLKELTTTIENEEARRRAIITNPGNATWPEVFGTFADSFGRKPSSHSLILDTLYNKKQDAKARELRSALAGLSVPYLEWLKSGTKESTPSISELLSNLNNPTIAGELEILWDELANIPWGAMTKDQQNKLGSLSQNLAMSQVNELARLANEGVLEKKPTGGYTVKDRQAYDVFLKKWNSLILDIPSHLRPDTQEKFNQSRLSATRG